MNNSDRIILDLCGGTGAWSKPYKDAGYDVRVITLPDYDVTQHMFNGYYLFFPRQPEPPLSDDYRECAEGINIFVPDIYGILAAPPCTEFSLAKSTKPRDFQAGMIVVKACMSIVWACRLRGTLMFWAMESPRGFLRQFIGKPAFSFEQWEFGERRIKPTDLWGYFNAPAKPVKVRPENLTTKFPNGRINTNGWSRKSHNPEYVHLTLADIRAITPPGFAKAFFKANQ